MPLTGLTYYWQAVWQAVTGFLWPVWCWLNINSQMIMYWNSARLPSSKVYRFYIHHSARLKPHKNWQISAMKFQWMIPNVQIRWHVLFQAISIRNGWIKCWMVLISHVCHLPLSVMNWYKNRLPRKNVLYCQRVMNRVPYRLRPFVRRVVLHSVFCWPSLKLC